MLTATEAAGAGRRPPTDEERERSRALRDRREREDLAAAARLARETMLRRAGVAGFADEAKGLRMWRDVAGGCPGFLLYGPPGTGKTSAAMGAAKAAVLAGATARVVSEPNLLAELRDAAVARGGEEDYQLTRLQRLGLLCLDDLGKGEVSPKMFARLFAVVDSRLRAGRPLVCTSNYAPAELAARYAAAVGAKDAGPMASRLATLRAVEMSGSDMRLAR